MFTQYDDRNRAGISVGRKTHIEHERYMKGNYFTEAAGEGGGRFSREIHPLSQRLNIELCENCACIRIIQISQIKFARRFAPRCRRELSQC